MAQVDVNILNPEFVEGLTSGYYSCRVDGMTYEKPTGKLVLDVIVMDEFKRSRGGAPNKGDSTKEDKK